MTSDAAGLSLADFASSPLQVMTLDEAQEAQFRFVETAARHLPDGRGLHNGELGLLEPYGQPHTTRIVEEILAEYFHADDAVLVRGAGTGAIRAAMFAAFPSGSRVVFHDAPIYHTTAVTVRAMGIQALRTDFNNLDSVPSADGAFVQHTRQRLGDRYVLAEVVGTLRTALGPRPIVVDDNYAVMKAHAIGCEVGADLSTVSGFKLLGPEGVGIVLGAAALTTTVREHNRSGGCQIQGHEAMELLRGMVYLPVAAAVQARVVDRVAERLNDGAVPGVVRAVAAHNEESDVLVLLDRPIAKQVIRHATAHGAAPHPVGAESRYEFAPLFYRVSKSMLAERPEWADLVIRINPCRAGDQFIVDLLAAAMAAATG